MDTKSLLSRIFYSAFILFALYVIFELARKILGGSLTTDSLIISLIILVLGILFRMNNSLNKSINKVDAKITSHISWHKGRDSKVRLVREQ